MRMQDPDRREGYFAAASAKPSLLLKGENPRLIDEWQMAPVLWDAVRTAEDQRQEEGLFILTGSTSVDNNTVMHSGTGRISRMKMYPMSLFESKESNGAIFLKKIFDDPNMDIDGIRSELTVEELIFFACRGGWPAIRSATTIRAGKKRCFTDPSIPVAAMGLSPEYLQTDGRYALIEFKLGSREIEEGAKHLLKISNLVKKHNEKEKQVPLREPDLLIIITSGEMAYSRADGVKVIPIGTLRD